MSWPSVPSGRSCGRACSIAGPNPISGASSSTAVEPIFKAGYQAYGLSHTVPLVRHFTLKDCQIFDEFPTWKNLMFLPVEVRKQAFADADTRTKLQGELDNLR